MKTLFLALTGCLLFGLGVTLFEIDVLGNRHYIIPVYDYDYTTFPPRNYIMGDLE